MTEPASNPNDPRINLDKTEQPDHPSGPQPGPLPAELPGSRRWAAARTGALCSPLPGPVSLPC